MCACNAITRPKQQQTSPAAAAATHKHTFGKSFAADVHVFIRNCYKYVRCSAWRCIQNELVFRVFRQNEDGCVVCRVVSANWRTQQWFFMSACQWILLLACSYRRKCCWCSAIGACAVLLPTAIRAHTVLCDKYAKFTEQNDDRSTRRSSPCVCVFEAKVEIYGCVRCVAFRQFIRFRDAIISLRINLRPNWCNY